MARQLLADYRGNTLCLTLNRPGQRNALSYSLLEELRQALSDRMKAGCRAVIISGNRDSFSAGADLNELTGTVEDMEMDISIGGVIDELHRLSITSVACVEAACIGGALDIALACDVRVASAEAFFQVPATRLGLLYNPQSIARMSKSFSRATLTRLFVSGERFDAAAAMKTGLITHLIEPHGTGAATAKPDRKPDACSRQAINHTRDLLAALYGGYYDPEYWNALYKDILASPERRKAVMRAKSKITMAGSDKMKFTDRCK